ncbi:MAG TPA: hypothetical protein DCM02_02730 [Flavobacterium sp.]|nr:hypothetical protein [Flavobacterium sp.]HAT81300.1 hypothetical protein [Flavobacterium sp.]
MIKKVIVYQTLEDRGNPEKIERDGPFPCTRNNAWLGVGYYFWDTFKENAHWWGKECNNYDEGYVICKAECDYDEEKCFDLVSNTDHLLMLHNTFELMKSKGLANSNTTVSRVIEYLKTDLKIFNFSASRASGVNSKSVSSNFSSHLIFDNKKGKLKYLDLKPAIQLCFYSKSSLNLRNYKIVFPDQYIDGFLI